ncbi:Ferric reductase like transmembrane component [uncultured archaeon]|nr:Ferric reductase like transmembrane component [uncultured archaeon]
MNLPEKILLSIAITTSLLLIYFTLYMTSDTPYVWYFTRATGLLAAALLTTSIFTSIIKKTFKTNAPQKLLHLHKWTSIGALITVFLHGTSVIFDHYQWKLGITNVLGLDYHNRWVALVSAGSIAFYLMVIVALTSITPSMMRRVGVKWRLIHYASYVVFLLGYIHSVNLGTDVRHSFFSVMVLPAFQATFLAFIVLFITRIVKTNSIFQTNLDTAAFAIVLGLILFTLLSALLTSVETLQMTDSLRQNITEVSQNMASLQQEGDVLSRVVSAITGGAK